MTNAPFDSTSIGAQFSAHWVGTLHYLQENGGDILWNLLATALIIVFSRAALSLVSHWTRAVMKADRYHHNERQGKRVNSIMTLLRSVVRYLVYFIAFFLILRQWNQENWVKGILAAAGVGSLAIGIGAQSLVKDVATGFFMIFENQFSVGDFVKIEGLEGYVEATAMRVTYLRSYYGEQYIIPNGSISRVINYSRGDNRASITIPISYETDTAVALGLIHTVADRYAKEHPELVLETPVVQGISSFAEAGPTISVVCRTRNLSHWQVERGLRLAILEEFARSGISFPYRHLVAEDAFVNPADHTPHTSSAKKAARLVPDAGPDKE